jgi:hypothetical protein
MSMVQAIDSVSVAAEFPRRPFPIRHRLAGHPLMTLPRIVELVRQLPRDQIEYNSGKAEINQDPNAIPTIDLDPEEVVRRIESCGAWMVLKRVEADPSYRKIVEDALLSVARAQGHASLVEAGFEDVRGFLFVSSPNSTTPFHLDSEDNLFVHIQGEKFFHIYDNEDRSIASEETIEHAVAKHRNVPYDPKFDAKGTTYRLLPGDGVFVPYQWPHWVSTADNYAISLAITWKTKEAQRRNDIFVVNSMLRSFGLPQQPPGKNPMLDMMKLAVLRAVSMIVAPLRKSETMRRALRFIALGRQANYFFRAPKNNKPKPV